MNSEEIKFSNQWFTGQHRIKEAGHYPFAVYGLLHYLEHMSGMVQIDVESILLWFKMETTTSRNIEKIKEAFKYLHQQDIIEFYEDVWCSIPTEVCLDSLKGKTKLHIRIKEKPQKGRYTLLKISEIETILADPKHKGKSKVRLLCYFASIVFHINQQSKRAYPRLEVLNDVGCIGRNDTCSKYNEHLMEDLKIMRYDSSGKINPETGNPYTTQYVRYEDKEALEAEMNRQRGFSDNAKLTKLIKANTNARRSVTGRIRKLEAKLKAMGVDAVYTKTGEYSTILQTIRSLKDEYKDLQEEYEILKAKKTL